MYDENGYRFIPFDISKKEHLEFYIQCIESLENYIDLSPPDKVSTIGTFIRRERERNLMYDTKNHPLVFLIVSNNNPMGIIEISIITKLFPVIYIHLKDYTSEIRNLYIGGGKILKNHFEEFKSHYSKFFESVRKADRTIYCTFLPFVKNIPIKVKIYDSLEKYPWSICKLNI